MSTPVPPVVRDALGRVSRRPDALSLAGFGAVTVLAPALGIAGSPPRPGTKGWYEGLDRPSFTPPSWAFGPVWTVLYGLIAVSGWRVWRAEPGPARTRALGLWGTQLALNAGWTPLFFGQRRPKASLVDVVALLGAVGAYAWAARRVDRPAAAMMLPYVAWVGLATALNFEIARRNPDASGQP